MLEVICGKFSSRKKCKLRSKRMKNCVYVSLCHQIVPEMLFLDGIFWFVQPKSYFLLCACTIPKGAVVSLSNFIYDVNTLVLKLKNLYFKGRLQFITTLNLLSCLSVHYKDTTMILEEELKLAFRP